MEVAVEAVEVPPVVVVPLVVGVEVEAVEVDELGVLMLLRGVKFTGMLKVFRAAPKVRAISLLVCKTSTSITTSDLVLSSSCMIFSASVMRSASPRAMMEKIIHDL